MAGTRAQRARETKMPAAEELRFDFSGDQPRAEQANPSIELAEPAALGANGHRELRASLAPLPVLASEGSPDLSSGSDVPAGDPGSSSDAALSVGAFYDRLRTALRETFPDEIWVTGEISKVTTSRGHHYLELADRLEAPVGRYLDAPGPGRSASAGRSGTATLEVACWARDWPAVQYELAAVGVELVPGLVVRVRGKVSVWEGGSKVRFSMTALDVEALVGGIAAARRRLLGALAAEDLLEANRRLPLALVPLRVGLVTSPGSEAYRDFVGQLARSGYLFDVRFEPCQVQGPEAPAQVAAALARMGGSDPQPQLVVVVRGGGAKGDLAAFDSEIVARAIAGAPFPVWTGIGHTGDRSVADEVAHRALVTPTHCGEVLVAVVAAYLDGLDRRARQLAQRVASHLDLASRDLADSSVAIGRCVRQCLDHSALAVRTAEARIGNAALVTIERSQGRLVNRAQRLSAPAVQRLVTQAQLVSHKRELLQLLDPRHQLQRGWSLTRDETGKVVRSSASLSPGDKVTTTFAEGSAVSVVNEIKLPALGRIDDTTNDGGIL